MEIQIHDTLKYERKERIRQSNNTYNSRNN